MYVIIHCPSAICSPNIVPSLMTAYSLHLRGVRTRGVLTSDNLHPGVPTAASLKANFDADQF